MATNALVTDLKIFGQQLLIHAFQEEGLGDEGLGDDLREGHQNLELAIGLGFTNVNVLGAMMIGLDGNLAAGAGEADIAGLQWTRRNPRQSISRSPYELSLSPTPNLRRNFPTPEEKKS